MSRFDHFDGSGVDSLVNSGFDSFNAKRKVWGALTMIFTNHAISIYSSGHHGLSDERWSQAWIDERARYEEEVALFRDVRSRAGLPLFGGTRGFFPNPTVFQTRQDFPGGHDHPPFYLPLSPEIPTAPGTTYPPFDGIPFPDDLFVRQQIGRAIDFWDEIESRVFNVIGGVDLTNIAFIEIAIRGGLEQAHIDAIARLSATLEQLTPNRLNDQITFHRRSADQNGEDWLRQLRARITQWRTTWERR